MDKLYELTPPDDAVIIPLKKLSWERSRDIGSFAFTSERQYESDALKNRLALIDERGMRPIYDANRDKFDKTLDRKGRPMTRAGRKLLEIISDIPQFLELIVEESSDPKKQPITRQATTFFDIAGGPGEFSRTLLERGLHGYGITLESPNHPESLLWYQDLYTNPNFTILRGAGTEKKQGDGDIRKVANFDAVVSELSPTSGTLERGVDIIVSDAAFGHDENQEVETARLVLSEIALGLSVLNYGGNFLCKLFATESLLTKSLIEILTICFSQCFIVKPASSRSVNSERYLVCVDFIDGDETRQLVKYLTAVFAEAEVQNRRKKLTVVPYTLFERIDKEFDKSLEISSVALYKLQDAALTKILDLIGIPEPSQLQERVETPDEANGLDLVYIPINSQTGQLAGPLDETVTPATILDLAERDVLVYPYKRFHMPNIYELFKGLKNFKPVVKSWQTLRGLRLNFEGRIPDLMTGPPNNRHFTVLESDGSDYKVNQITDYFTEPSRMTTLIKDVPLSPADFWRRNADWVISEMRRQKIEITPYNMREFLFRNIREATQFKATNSKWIYEWVARRMKLKEIRVLDPCGGHGDRLMGALGSDVVSVYEATDPNPELVSGWSEMIATFAPKKPRRYRLHTIPAQEINEKFGMFEMVFTSPPYFDYEIYSSLPGQSYTQGESLDAWINNFLYIMLDRAWERIVEGGFMIIHLTDVQKIRMCEPMYLHMKAKGDADFQGAIIAKAKNVIPMWIWRKISAK